MSDLTILAAPRATAEHCIRYLLARPHGAYSEHDITNVIVPAYFRVASSVGVDPALLVAQLIHETGGLTSWWSQRPRRNPAGIGVTGAKSAHKPASGAWQYDPRVNLWREGIAFADWEKDAVPAHVGRMLAYALPAGQGTDVQRALIAKALSYRPLPAAYRGAAPTLAGLVGRWAVPGTEYPAKIAALLTAIQAGAQAPARSALEQLNILDLSAPIAALPRKRGAEHLPLRTEDEDSITLHYSGVVYADRSEAAELARIIDEAAYHLGKNWAKAGQPPIYADRMMYELVVLTGGRIVRTNRERVQLWHAGNKTANARSYSIHWMLGKGQALSAAQRASTIALLDALRADGDIPRSDVFGHNEWPRTRGVPQRMTTYRLLAGQSECPGSLLHKFIVDYRAGRV
jgi:hypothetical protein